MALKSALIGSTEKGRELVRLKEDGTDATVPPSECDAATLRELAKACVEAAEQIEAFKRGTQ